MKTMKTMQPTYQIRVTNHLACTDVMLGPDSQPMEFEALQSAIVYAESEIRTYCCSGESVELVIEQHDKEGSETVVQVMYDSASGQYSPDVSEHSRVYREYDTIMEAHNAPMMI